MNFRKFWVRKILKRWHKKACHWHWYSTWHRFSFHKAFHWTMLVVFVIGIMVGGWGVPYLQTVLPAQAAVQPNGPINPFTDGFVTNGQIITMAIAGDGTKYLGGTFTAIGPDIGAGAPVGATTGLPLSTFPKVRGQIRVVISDGSGGWYIGGEFSQIDNQTRNNLAHINADGSLDAAWNPNVNDVVYSLVISGTTVYVGGGFTTVGGVARNRLAAVGTDGTLLNWDPNTNNIVYSIIVDGSIIYIGGMFTTVGGVTRNRLAAIDTGGFVQAWDPNVGNGIDITIVLSLVIDGSTIYAGGIFTTIGGTTRNRLAAISTAGVLQDWNPNVNGIVYSLVLDGTTIYVGGSFSTIGGTTRNNLAAIDTAGILQDWNPNVNNFVYTLTISDSIIYVGGDFTTIGGTARNRVAAISTAGVLQDWNPNANNRVYALAINGSTVYVAGTFFTLGGFVRNRLAAISASGTLLDWNPNANDVVFSLVLSGSTIYAGGNFTTIDGTARNYLAAINTSGTLLDWNPVSGGMVLALAVSDSTVYAGGTFNYMGGITRNRLAAIDTSGTLLDWNPNVSDPVRSLLVAGSTVYVGGDFITIGDVTRNHLAAISTSGTLLDWNPNINGSVYSLALNGSIMYLGGGFTTIGGVTRNSAAAISTDGILQSWNPNTNSWSLVYSLAISGSTVYLGGSFTTISGVTRNYLAAIGTDGTLHSWDPGVDGGVFSLVISGSTLYVGGGFTYIGLTYQPYLTSFTFPTVQLSSTTGSDAESVTSPTVTVSINDTSTLDTTVSYAVTGGTATGSGVDYTLASGTATITAGLTSTTIPLAIVNDDLVESSETIVISLSSPTNSTLGVNTTYTYTITDNDNNPTTPTNSTPTNNQQSINPNNTILTSSSFADVDVGNTHTSSQWQITATTANYTSPAYDSGTDTTNKVSITLPANTLHACTTYYWHLRHRDNGTNWSAYSTETSFKTGSCGSTAAATAAAIAASSSSTSPDTNLNPLEARADNVLSLPPPALSPPIIPLSTPADITETTILAPPISKTLSSSAIQCCVTDTNPATTRDYQYQNGDQVITANTSKQLYNSTNNETTVCFTETNLPSDTIPASRGIARVTLGGFSSLPIACPDNLRTYANPPNFVGAEVLNNEQHQPIAIYLQPSISSSNPNYTEYQVIVEARDHTYYITDQGRLSTIPTWLDNNNYPYPPYFYAPQPNTTYALSTKARNQELIETNSVFFTPITIPNNVTAVNTKTPPTTLTINNQTVPLGDSLSQDADIPENVVVVAAGPSSLALTQELANREQQSVEVVSPPALPPVTPVTPPVLTYTPPSAPPPAVPSSPSPALPPAVKAATGLSQGLIQQLQTLNLNLNRDQIITLLQGEFLTFTLDGQTYTLTVKIIDGQTVEVVVDQV